MNGKGYGMPSSHAQFVAFFSISLTLFLLFRHTPKSASVYHTPLTLASRALLSLIAILCASTVAASRIYLNYHTVRQVLVGCGAGAFSAIAWFLTTTLFRRQGWVDWVLYTEWATLLRMRDLVIEEDLAEAGWEKWVMRKTGERHGNGELKRGMKKKI